MLSQLPVDAAGEALEPDRLHDAVDLILSLQVGFTHFSGDLNTIEFGTLTREHDPILQNSSGGFATYELTRSYEWLEVTQLKKKKTHHINQEKENEI